MVTREKFKVMHNVFDGFTERTIYKLITEGYFKGLESPISVGKEANIFSARSKEGLLMVKIYRLETCNFNQMYDYIKYDPRYEHLLRQRRKIIFAWVQREYRNLMKAREAGVRVPLPYTFKNHVVVMEYIGSNMIAPKLKDKDPKDPAAFLDDLVENLRRMFKADLVHADLSPFNILNHREKPVIIDFSQTSTLQHPRASEFLDRDIKIICNYFRKQGVDCQENEIRKRITKG